MFENIIGHKAVIRQLSDEVSSGRLPGSILIEGAQYAGKLTIALELARALTCTGDRKWNCRCRACRYQKQLVNPDTILLGPDDFMEEIHLTASLLKESNEFYSRYLFLRAVRKLLHRINPVFFDDKESRVRKAEPFIAEIEEKLDGFNPDLDTGINEKFIDSVVSAAAALSKETNLINISVDYIRKIIFWSHTTGLEKNKVIIIENCEKMNESARNSMLKILEEPPEKCFFIFLSSNPGEIIETIRSRLRVYSLRERSPEENRQVIERIFREKDSQLSSVSRFFAERNPAFGETDNAARIFTDFFFSGDDGPDSKREIRETLKCVESSNIRLFYERLLFHSRKYLTGKEDEFTVYRLEALNRFLRTSRYNHETLNMNTELLIESLISFREETI